MTVAPSKDVRQRTVASIERYFVERMDEAIGNWSGVDRATRSR